MLEPRSRSYPKTAKNTHVGCALPNATSVFAQKKSG